MKYTNLVRVLYPTYHEKQHQKHIAQYHVKYRNQNYHIAMGNQMTYEITQCYLPPDSGDFPAFTPAKAGTRFSNPGG